MWQRMAGLRTNALVLLAAASFVTFAALFPNDINPKRVAAQVVSGIGLLGAGIIFRDGFNVHGLNTAATLWCSAAVGMMAGRSHLNYAALMTGMIVFINLALRPIVKLLNKFSSSPTSIDRLFQMLLRCEREMRTFLVQILEANNLHLYGTEVNGDETEVMIIANIHSEGAIKRNIERSVSQIAIEPRITCTFWCALDEMIT